MWVGGVRGGGGLCSTRQIRVTCTGCQWPASARAPARSPSPAVGRGSLGGGAWASAPPTRSGAGPRALAEEGEGRGGHE